MKKFLLTLTTLAAVLSMTARNQADTLAIASRSHASPLKVTVVQPEQALKDGNTSRFPTVYLLNGYSGDYTTWPKLQNLDSLATHYGMIFVCPDGRDSWYWDSPLNNKMKMESFIVKTLVPYIDSHYPTIDDPSKRAITGLSMGGHGALYLAIRNSDIFGNAGSTSGGVDITKFPDKWKMDRTLGKYAQNRETWNRHSVTNIARQLKPGQLNIIFDCGESDFFKPVNDNLHRQLLEDGIKHDYISRPGRHSQPYWSNAILYQLMFFDRNFNNRTRVTAAEK